MAKHEDILAALELFEKNRPQKPFDEIEKNDMGIFAVLKYLNEADGEINSKNISNYLGVSSARMAIVLKKMEQKNWIRKKNSASDARAIIVELTEEGITISKKKKEEMFKTIEKILDIFTLVEIEDLLYKLNVIKGIVKESQREMEDK